MEPAKQRAPTRRRSTITASTPQRRSTITYRASSPRAPNELSVLLDAGNTEIIFVFRWLTAPITTIMTSPTFSKEATGLTSSGLTSSFFVERPEMFDARVRGDTLHGDAL